MKRGEAKFKTSTFFARKVLVIESEHIVGTAFKFHKKIEYTVACASCKALGKARVVTVENCRIFNRKHL